MSESLGESRSGRLTDAGNDGCCVGLDRGNTTPPGRGAVGRRQREYAVRLNENLRQPGRRRSMPAIYDRRPHVAAGGDAVAFGCISSVIDATAAAVAGSDAHLSCYWAAE